MIRRGVVTVILVFAASVSFANDVVLTVEESPGVLGILANNRPIATYVYADSSIPRPYFKDLHTLSGLRITRHSPPIEGDEPTDHATYHPGLWMAFGDINGADFWRNKATVRHNRFVESPAVKNGVLSFAVENAYEWDAAVLCTEVSRYRLSVTGKRWTLAIASTFSPVAGPLIFGDQEEMGLGVRVASALMAERDGLIRNSEGAINEDGVWGKAAAWCSYSAEEYGERYGIAIAPSLTNFRASWFHARDYGLLVANPFGQKAFTGGEASAVLVPEGETLALGFTVVVFEGETNPGPFRPE